MSTPTMTQKLTAEAVGTAILVFIGAGSVPLTVFLTAGAGGTGIAGTAGLSTISFSFAFAIFAAVYSIGHISGCHINPAVTISLLATRKIDARTAGGYIGAQLVGAFLGAALTLIILQGNDPAALGLGAVSVNAKAGLAIGFAAEVIGTAILVFTVFGAAVSGKAPSGFAGLIIGFIVYGIIILVGPITGAVPESGSRARSRHPRPGHRRGARPGRAAHRRLHLRIDDRRRDRRIPLRVHRARGRGNGHCAVVCPRHRKRRRLDPDRPLIPTVTDHTKESPMATNAPSRVKKLINDVEDIVPESLAGLQAAHPDLVTIDTSQNLVLRAGGPKPGKVGLVSGGGSGHEPLHGGFVGPGHARCCRRGQRVHVARAGPDGGRDPRGRRRCRRAAHRQELHRRRPELPARRRARRRARSRSRRSSPTTTSRSRTRSTRPAAAVSASPCCSRRSLARTRRRADRSPRWRRRRPR